MGVSTKGERKYFKLTRRINTLLLATHVCLLALFAYLQITLMVYVNIASVFFYLFLFLIYKKSVARYVFLAYLEVMIHMVLATISVGWDGGFQHYSFCLIPCAFLCDYLSRTEGGKSMHPIKISVIVVAIFLAVRWFCMKEVALYTLPSSEGYTFMYSYNAIVTFIFLMVYMSTFRDYILKKEKQLESMAELDELTKLPNRYLMHEWLSEGFNDSTSSDKMTVAMLDIDDFKSLNDTNGHECGDMVLREIAGDISRITNDHLRACRWGGEEFVLMATGKDAYGRMIEVLEELRRNIEKKTISYRNKEVHITVTIGMAEYRLEDTSFHDILKRADERLYFGKERGKNRVVGKA